MKNGNNTYNKSLLRRKWKKRYTLKWRTMKQVLKLISEGKEVVITLKMYKKDSITFKETESLLKFSKQDKRWHVAKTENIPASQHNAMQEQISRRSA